MLNSKIISTMSAEDGEKNLNVYYMAIALLAERRSKDPVRKVGACIVNEKEGIKDKGLKGRAIGIGYNGMPLNCRDGLMPWDKIPGKKNLKSFYVVHAEANAIVNMNPQSVANCAIYVTLHPCVECAKKLVLSGVSKVVFLSFDKCYSDRKDFERSEKLLKGADKIEYMEFPCKRTTEKRILEINFQFPDEKYPRQDGSHSIWWHNEVRPSENKPGPKDNYKAGEKYIGKKMDMLKKEIIELLELVKTQEEKKKTLADKTEELNKLEARWKVIEKDVQPISWEQYFMGMAIIAGDFTGSKAHEGACIVNKDKRIIGLGYCRTIGQIEEEKEDQKLGIDIGVHAPVTAIVNRNPVSLRGCTLYVTQFPCHECAKDIVQAGIKTIIYLDGGNAEDKNPAGVSAEVESLGEGCPNQQVEVEAKNVSPGGCAEHQKVYVKDEKIKPDPAENIFDLARVKYVSYRKSYNMDSVLLDFSEPDPQD